MALYGYAYTLELGFCSPVDNLCRPATIMKVRVVCRCPFASLHFLAVPGPLMVPKVVPVRRSRSHDHGGTFGFFIRVLECKIHAVKHECTKLGKLAQLPNKDKIADVSLSLR